ncbi:DUF4911 domain-containing protein [Thermodesulforhabdus norvegica]|uniref:DUF4911 domain-containing protein n=1 Tax=Thermodesulforhabdus norvegica TaxID=39841 RepID=A0A1I4STG0_9BACT|nr:DUF4911 domain-containing protein [Thermodesulforhabdus norvegica]SFM67744.1 protein of unknown function [Thermodesulforhabdus norvegica]
MVKQSTIRYYYIKPEKIHYLSFILEAYEGVAVVTTIDRSRGLIMLQISPGQEDVMDALITCEKDSLGLQPFAGEENIETLERRPAGSDENSLC